MSITIEPLNKENWLPVCQLSVSEEQKQVFSVANVYWIGISRYEEHTELFAIMQDDKYVGLIGGGYYEDSISGCINPLMVDYRYQRQGIATEVMQLMIQYLVRHLNVDRIYIGHRKVNHTAARIYEKLGFEIVEETEQDYGRCLQLKRCWNGNS